MTRTARAAVLLLLAVALAPYPSAPAAASCAAPELQVAGTSEQPPVLTVGGPVRVTGRSFVDECDDTGGGSVLGCSEPEVVVNPLSDLTLELRQADRTWQLGTTDAESADDGRLGRAVWRVVVPPDVQPGQARLVAGDSEPLPVTIAP